MPPRVFFGQCLQRFLCVSAGSIRLGVASGGRVASSLFSIDPGGFVSYFPPTMRWHTSTLCTAIVLSTLVVELRGQPGTAFPDERHSESVLVLLSGEVIRGEVSKEDDRYLVVLPTGRIFVPTHTVEVVCRSLSEAYEYRRSRMGQGQAQDHAELAQWCERHGLDNAAHEQLQLAKGLDPDHPIVGLVERRLAAARIVASESDVAERAPDTGEPTAQQLADFAAGLPHGTVESFTRVVQPMLINRCATAGCHSDRSDNEFRLERSRPGTPLGQTSTHRNLLATLKLVDSSSPEECELLRPKKCPHRLQVDGAASLSRTSQYRFLVAWVKLLAQQSESSSTVPQVADGPPATIRSGPPAEPSEPSVVSGDASPGERLTRVVEGPDESDVPQASRFSAGNRSADPFDPAVFNARYGTTSPGDSAEGEPAKVPVPSPFFPG